MSNRYEFNGDCLIDNNKRAIGEEDITVCDYDDYESFVILFNQQDQQISDLEAKLAESEKNFVVANNLRKNSDEVLLNYKTEKYGLEKTIQELRKIKLSLPEKEWYYKGFENCERQMSSHIADLTLEVKELKQQLAESESRFQAHKQNDARIIQDHLDLIENLKQQVKEKEKKLAEYSDINNALNSGIKDKCIYCEEEHNQDKISFALEQLEKVKNRIEINVESIYKRLDDLNINIVCESTSRQLDTYGEIVKEIDNQIKQLKEGE